MLFFCESAFCSGVPSWEFKKVEEKKDSFLSLEELCDPFALPLFILRVFFLGFHQQQITKVNHPISCFRKDIETIQRESLNLLLLSAPGTILLSSESEDEVSLLKYDSLCLVSRPSCAFPSAHGGYLPLSSLSSFKLNVSSSEKSEPLNQSASSLYYHLTTYDFIFHSAFPKCDYVFTCWLIFCQYPLLQYKLHKSKDCVFISYSSALDALNALNKLMKKISFLG